MGALQAVLVGRQQQAGGDESAEAVEAGALLCLFTAGAYGMSMASNYNARPRAAEVLVDGDRWAIITERETYDDLVRRETVLVAQPTASARPQK